MIFIPGNVPSLKNSKVKTNKGIFSSPTVTKYLRSLGIQSFNSGKKIVKGYKDPNRPNVIESFRDTIHDMKIDKENPLFIGFHHVRKSKRRFDFSNSVELIQDLFVAHNFIEDDNVDCILPIPMTIDGELPSVDNLRKKAWFSYNKKKPGVYIKIF